MSVQKNKGSHGCSFDAAPMTTEPKRVIKFTGKQPSEAEAVLWLAYCDAAAFRLAVAKAVHEEAIKTARHPQNTTQAVLGQPASQPILEVA